MHTYLEDRQQITDLLTGWIHRDTGEWDQLRDLFHPDGTIEITGLKVWPAISSTAQCAWAHQRRVPNI